MPSSRPSNVSPNVTLHDVAREAGVSLATASRAYNGSERKVREDLRQRVLDAAVRLGYTANATAQAMARGRSNVVGLVVSDIADPYFATIAAGVMAAADEHGLLVTLGSTVRRPERELDYLESHRAQRSRGVVLAGSRVADPALNRRLVAAIEAFETAGGRVVAISQERLPVDTLVIDNRGGAKALAAELVALGYRRFGILTGPRGLLTAKDRTKGFTEGLRAAGLTEIASVAGEFTRDGGFDAMLTLLDERHDLDCVFAVNDVMAVGAMAACRSRGLHLPADLALAGFDDIATLRDVDPGLTTVRLPLEQLGAQALELLSGEPAAEPRRTPVRGEVVVRASTPPR